MYLFLRIFNRVFMKIKLLMFINAIVVLASQAYALEPIKVDYASMKKIQEGPSPSVIGNGWLMC